jgi:hypothetical protein
MNLEVTKIVFMVTHRPPIAPEPTREDLRVYSSSEKIATGIMQCKN